MPKGQHNRTPIELADGTRFASLTDFLDKVHKEQKHLAKTQRHEGSRQQALEALWRQYLIGATMKIKQKPCAHPDYVFDYARGEHVCEYCRLRWRDTGRDVETDNYIFDRLLGR